MHIQRVHAVLMQFTEPYTEFMQPILMEPPEDRRLKTIIRQISEKKHIRRDHAVHTQLTEPHTELTQTILSEPPEDRMLKNIIRPISKNYIHTYGELMLFICSFQNHTQSCFISLDSSSCHLIQGTAKEPPQDRRLK